MIGVEASSEEIPGRAPARVHGRRTNNRLEAEWLSIGNTGGGITLSGYKGGTWKQCGRQQFTGEDR
jgi:hypothetical protein